MAHSLTTVVALIALLLQCVVPACAPHHESFAGSEAERAEETDTARCLVNAQEAMHGLRLAVPDKQLRHEHSPGLPCDPHEDGGCPICRARSALYLPLTPIDVRELPAGYGQGLDTIETLDDLVQVTGRAAGSDCGRESIAPWLQRTRWRSTLQVWLI